MGTPLSTDHDLPADRLAGLLFDHAYLKKIEDRIYDRAVAHSAEGMKIVGLYCAFTPKELVAAAGAIPVSLCAGSEEPFPVAEQHLPANLCPLIKSSYGHAVADTCPYFHMTDCLLADATCDGKKKMFELLRRLRPLHLLVLPQSPDPATYLDPWKKELQGVVTFMQEQTGHPITSDALKRQIWLYNRLRRTIEHVFDLNTGETPLVYGSEIDRITTTGGFECDLEGRITEMEAAIEMVRDRSRSASFLAHMRKRPRILLTGCPNTNRKLLHQIEAAGGVVVAMESCGGLKTVGRRVSETAEPLHALAEKYLNTACACMTPNTQRLDLLGDLIDRFRIDGVVNLTWTACHTYHVEAFLVQETVQQHEQTPYIHIVTDYSENDRGQLQTRIEAFLEMLT